MQTHVPTTPFGRRSLSLAHIGAEVVARRASPETAVHKWTLFRAICAAKARIGVSDRALAVLDALLSFHPETALVGGDGGGGLVVFPSNEQLARRAHGMAASTLRRHLAQLVDLGLIVRRDSPNGKRYARKDADGAVETAFGFDLAPLVARAAEFERLAAEIEAEERARRLARERLTLLRRDLSKMIATGIEARVPVVRRDISGRRDLSGQVAGQGIGSWIEIEALYRATLARLPRTAARATLEAVADDLALLAEEVFNILEDHLNQTNPDANESRSGRHIQNSKPDPLPDLELGLREGEAARPDGMTEVEPAENHGYQKIDAGERELAEARTLPGAPGRLHRTADHTSTPAGSEDAGRPARSRGEGQEGRRADAGFDAATQRPHWPLGFVLDACPDIAAFAKGGIGHWRDLVATASVVRSMLGISPSAWDEACAVLGETDAAITVAAIFQRADEIRAPGGYLRSLTAKARAGGFSLGPVLMALSARRARSTAGEAARSA
jgi:replication initiation protein RepC